MSKTTIEKLSLLKKGDSALVYTNDCRQSIYNGEECTVTTIGKDNIYVKDKWGKLYKFTKDGYCDGNVLLFPGNKEEFAEYRETLEFKKIVGDLFKERLPYLTKDKIDKIMGILSENM